ncbi:ABC transporter ATP-binding protein [Nocardioidaceae bacterium]|nr:ABC transporter ATP-binding protein [Nocardioidaceae bacterium]
MTAAHDLHASPGSTGSVVPALHLHAVAKSYGDVPAVRGVDLTVAAHEVVTLVGPSGCGKSTLLRLAAGLDQPDTGSIDVGGREVAGRVFVPAEQRRVGLVFQDHALFPHLDVGRNVAFGLPRGERDGRTPRVMEVLDLVGLAHLATRFPHELSGGEQQRVALARALAPRPAVVLLDEPFSSLDTNLRSRVRADTLAALAETGSAAMIVTHDQTEALSLGHRLGVMHGGHLLQLGSPAEVYERPTSRFVATFMGEADFLPARVDRALLTSEIGVVSTVPGWGGVRAQVEVMLRPHEVALRADAEAAHVVERVEYHGAFHLHHVRLASGLSVRSWQQHDVRLEPGTPVSVSVSPGATPVLMSGEKVLTAPPPLAG